MLKKITLIFIAILLMMNMYIGVIYAVEETNQEQFQRTGHIIFMFLLFIIAIILVGGKQGIRATISLIVNFFVLYFVLIKLVFAGINVFFVSLLTSFLIMSISFFIIIGINRKTISGIIGSFLGTLISGVLAVIFGNITKLSGVNEEIIQLSSNLKTIDFNYRNLIFLSVVISSIGICMDIGIAIINGLDGIRSKSEDSSLKELFKNGINVGRNLIGTMSNTFILTYIGGIIKLILIYKACNIQMTYIINKEIICELIVLAIAGSIGVICTIPFTALSYSVINRKKTIYKKTSENKIEGKRSLKI
ncbi:MAG: YibE/F family protein [Clostridia bacterium]|nr:YibE/F family protein [Clostridia bacterium]